MKIVYAPRALHGIDENLAYIHERNPRGTHNVSLAIERAIAIYAPAVTLPASRASPASPMKTDLRDNQLAPRPGSLSCTLLTAHPPCAATEDEA